MPAGWICSVDKYTRTDATSESTNIPMILPDYQWHKYLLLFRCLFCKYVGWRGKPWGWEYVPGWNKGLIIKLVGILRLEAQVFSNYRRVSHLPVWASKPVWASVSAHDYPAVGASAPAWEPLPSALCRSLSPICLCQLHLCYIPSSCVCLCVSWCVDPICLCVRPHPSTHDYLIQ